MNGFQRVLVWSVIACLGACGASRDAELRGDGAADAVAMDGGASDGSTGPGDGASGDGANDGVGRGGEDAPLCEGGVVCTGRCVDLATDVQNCGGCGNDCSRLPGVVGALARCVAGVCDVSTACAPGRAHCSVDPFDGCEADLTTPARCGTCTTTCRGATPLCAARSVGTRVTFECTSGCMTDAPTRCGDACVNTRSNLSHCGACGAACVAGPHAVPSCADGRCAFTCEAGFGNCDGNWANGCEVDLRSDTSHCGACGTLCVPPAGGTAVCASSVCDFVCNADHERCGGTCVRRDDPDYGCGTGTCSACGAPENVASMRCEATHCVIGTCNLGYVQCGGRCVSLTDPAYGCGAADCRPCAVPTGAGRMTCSAFGTCQIAACAPGFKMCGGRCVPTSDPAYGCGGASCGRCLLDHATPACAPTGACDYVACQPGWRDLDGDRTNGCETEAPANLTGLRVWLSVAEPGSLETDPRCAMRGCVRSWRNLADPGNSATQLNPLDAPSALIAPDGSGSQVMFGTSGAPTFGYVPEERRQHTLNIDLSFLNWHRYSIWTVVRPISGLANNYAIGCHNRDAFTRNHGLHFGWMDDNTVRLSHWWNDLDVVARLPSTTTILHGRLSYAGRVLTARRNGGFFATATDAQTEPLEETNACALGRGFSLEGDTSFRGGIFEVVLYDRALVPAEADRVDTYLRRRWNIR